MPTKPPSALDRTPAKGVHPMVNPHFQCGMPHDPKMRNEPNLPSRHLCSTPFSAKRTQFSHTTSPTTPLFWQNEPNFRPFQANHAGRRSVPSIGKPNLPHQHHPIYPIMQNEPNLHRAKPVEDQKMQNEPNSRIPRVPPPPISAKRTQFTNAQYTFYNPQYTIPWPNLPHRHLEDVGVIIDQKLVFPKKGALC